MSNTKKPFPSNPEIETFRYRGPNRRENSSLDPAEADLSAEVSFDSKGNPVLDIRTDASRRRTDDETLDLLKCLENSSLSIDDE